MKPLAKVIITVLTASMVLLGCSQQASPTQTNEVQTAVAGTLSAMQTQISDAAKQQTAMAALPTQTPVVIPTATFAPTATGSTPVVAATTSTTQESTGPSYRLGYVKALLYPNETYVNTRASFEEIWSIKNVGTATWPADTKVIAADDNPFNLADGTTIGQVVSNRQTFELHVNLKAPEVANNYTAKFLLETPDGKKFGIGSNFDQPFTVLLYVR